MDEFHSDILLRREMWFHAKFQQEKTMKALPASRFVRLSVFKVRLSVFILFKVNLMNECSTATC